MPVLSDPFSQRLLYAGLKAALGNKRRTLSSFDRRLLLLAHFGLRLRYTLPGRWLFRIVPLRWKRILKEKLLVIEERDLGTG